MSTTKNTPGEPVSTAAAEVESIARLYTKSVERIAEVQKKGIDLAVKQNAELLEACKKVAETLPGAPGLFMLDIAANAFQRYADTQKSAIDLVLEQSHALAGLARERAASTATATEGASAAVKQTVEKSVETQKKALEFSAAQSKAAFESAKKQLGLSGPAEQVAESFQRGVDGLLATQKELLDIAAKPFSVAS